MLALHFIVWTVCNLQNQRLAKCLGYFQFFINCVSLGLYLYIFPQDWNFREISVQSFKVLKHFVLLPSTNYFSLCQEKWELVIIYIPLIAQVFVFPLVFILCLLEEQLIQVEMFICFVSFLSSIPRRVLDTQKKELKYLLDID